MRGRNSILRSTLLTWLVMLTLIAPAAGAGPKNPYDEYRNDRYSNDKLMSEREEMSLGAQVHQQVLQQYRLVRDPEINEYVQTLGERIARRSRRSNIPYHFYVIDDPSVNAFALPGGYIYVNAGLLNIAQTEDELSAAMAHEVGHVVARHGLKNVKKAQRTALIFGILGIGAEIATGGSGGGRAARAASELLAAGLITKNSRDYEREADYLGLYNMRDAGFNPHGMVGMFQRLERAGSSKQSSIGGIFASHPNAGERIRNTQTEISQHLGGNAYAQNSYSPTRRRRATSSSSSDFARMKAALAGYANGNRTYRGNRRDRQNRSNDPYYDPNDPANRPAENKRPVLTRRP